MTESCILGTFSLELFARFGDVSLFLALAAAGDAAVFVLTMELKVDLDGKTDGFEVTEWATFDIFDACRTDVMLLSKAHELIDLWVSFGNQTQLKFAESVSATTWTRKLEAGLSSLGLQVCLHTIKTDEVCICRVASDDSVERVFIKAGSTVHC